MGRLLEMTDQLIGECRKVDRENVFKRGRLVTTLQRYGITVDVSDLSSLGARIHLALSVKLPPTFDLWLDDEGTIHPSRICWRLKDQIGVEFTADPIRTTTKIVTERYP
jgi:hypothetical protein